MGFYSEKVFEKSFTNDVSKKAYLELCRWAAINIFNNKNLSSYVTVKIEKLKKKKPTFLLTVFLCVDEKEIKENYCKKCKQLHTIFYCVDKPRCEECKLHGYKKTLEDNVKNMKEFIKGVLENDWEEE